MVSVELCPKCHASIALPSPKSSFGEDCARAFQNPPGSVVACIKSSLATLPGVIAGLVQEIVRVESILIALKAHHAHLDTYIKQNTQYIRPSSVRRLPTEVLGIIFASACTSFRRSEYKTPLSISLVCSKWRDIALSTPSLWTHIYVAPRAGGLGVYNHFLERCGNIPISVKVDIPYRDGFPSQNISEHITYEETIDYHKDFLSAIGQTCAQWKVAELCMNQADINLLGGDIRDALDFPVLESLTIVNDGPPNYLIFQLFGYASSLTSFTILDGKGSKVECRYYVRALPWSQLREVCVQSDVYNLKIHLNEVEDDNSRTLVLRPHSYYIHLPLNVQFSLRVSTLVLDSVVWSSSLSKFFHFVTIPTLQSLTMMPPDPSMTHGYHVPAEWTNPFPALLVFLDRSGCALRVFTVLMRGRYEGGTYDSSTAQPTMADSLVAAFHSMTELRSLRIIEAESGLSLLNERLFREMTEGRLLPEVNALELVWAEERQPDTALIPMLNLRCGQGDAGIESLSSVVLGVRDGGDLPGDVLDCMMGLRQRGIRATLW